MPVLRRTKIVATLGPSTSSPERIDALIRAGLDVARLNFSHGSADDHRERARLVREIAAKQGRFVAIMGDLQGPKIRIARFTDKLVQLQVGQPFTLSRVHPKEAGNASIVGIDYPELVTDCRVGDELLLDDGRVVLVVDRVEGDEVHTTVTVGGPLSNNKGINRRGGGLSAPSLTDKDRVDIKLAAEMELDYVAVSFPRYGSDIDEARTLLAEAGSQAWIIAKIERAEAVADDEALDALIRASDGVMVARGDLGVEVGDAELVGIQKRIIQHARTLNKVVITATQMMESMISSPMPTRAGSVGRGQCSAGLYGRRHAVGRKRIGPVSGGSRAGDGACVPGRRKAPDHDEIASPGGRDLHALRRDHRVGGHVCGQPLPGREGGHRADGKRAHAVDHVAHPIRRADLLLQPS